MRKLSNEELQVLLQGAKNGTLDLRQIPDYCDELPPIFYGRCEKMADGSAKWSVEHLPITSKSLWENYVAQETRNPIVHLSKSERNEIIKASISGMIDEGLVQSVYPLRQKPFMCDYIRFGFDGKEEPTNEPPAEWGEMFRGAIAPPPPIMSDGTIATEPFPHIVFVGYSNEDSEKMVREWNWNGSDVEGWDFSIGKPMDIWEARWWNFHSMGTMMAIHRQ